MSSPVQSLSVVCRGCNESRTFDAVALENELGGEKPTMDNINSLFLPLGSRVCGDKEYDIFLHDKRKIFDSTRKVLCEACKHPLSLLFIEARPQAKICISCTKSKNGPQEDLKTPKIPEKFKICPKCKKPTEHRWDKDGVLFIGCTGYRGPSYGCNYTRPWPEG